MGCSLFVDRPKTKPHLVRLAEAVALLVKAPRTVSDLRDEMGITNTHQAPKYVRLLRDEGLVYISEWRRCHNTWTAVYAWQPSVCHYSDAQRP